MPLGDNIYKATTEPVKQPGPGGYLQRSSERGCCPGRKKRMQYLLVLFATLSFFGALLLIVIGSTGNSQVLVLSFLISLALIGLGSGLIICYLRAQGRINLPCWPSRAARLSRTLIGGGPGAGYAPTGGSTTPPRSGTQMTLAEAEETSLTLSSSGVREAAERAKLMEETDTLDADKITESRPKVELMT